MSDSGKALDEIIRMYARQPPRQSTREMLLAVSAGDQKDWLTGYEEMNREIGDPPKGRPQRTDEFPDLGTDFEAEEALMRSRPYWVRVILASGEFFRQTEVDTRINIGKKASAVARTPDGEQIFNAPADADLIDAVDRVRQGMQGAGKYKREMNAQAEAMELFHLLDWGLHENKSDIERGAFDSTMQVIDTVLNVLNHPLFFVKFALAVPRPSHVGKPFKPHIEEPKHPSLPSGHATAATAIALVLADLTGAGEDPNLLSRLQTVKERIGKNRERAGLHTHIDTESGILLGTALAEWMLDAAKKANHSYPSWCVMYAAATAEWT